MSTNFLVSACLLPREGGAVLLAPIALEYAQLPPMTSHVRHV
jgi:hypothetical protein